MMMTLNEIICLEMFVGRCADEWERDESIDWQDAEDIVSRLKRLMTEEALKLCPKIEMILAEAEEHEDWDCDVVGNWPEAIINELRNLRKEMA